MLIVNEMPSVSPPFPCFLIHKNTPLITNKAKKNKLEMVALQNHTVSLLLSSVVSIISLKVNSLRERRTDPLIDKADHVCQV